MTYLHPPPSPNLPVVVQRDLGGLVSDYKAMTEVYRQQNREVRLHECRSACTLALSLPNVCVYPSSVLRFHSAYHRDTKQVDQSVSRELLAAYPPAVRARLGNHLTRQYRSLSGAELIRLGVRDCTKPAGGTMIARAQQAPSTAIGAHGAPVQQASSGVDSLLGGVKSFLGLGGHTPAAAQAPQRAVMTAALKPANLRTLTPPLPPIRPEGLGEFDQGDHSQVAFAEAPLPPRRSDRVNAADDRVTPGLRRDLPPMITGAQPILPAAFSAYAPLR